MAPARHVWYGRALLACGVFALAALAPALAQASAPKPTILVSARAGDGHPLALASRTVAGTIYLFARGVSQARSARFAVDNRLVGKVSGSGTTLPPLRFATTTVKDGIHVITAVIVTAAGKKSSVKVFARVANRVSSEALIATALALHGIDYGTSLLYRFYAQWSDKRLPASLLGTGPVADEDLSIEASVAVAKKRVASSEATKLEAFLGRPTDTSSVFSPSAGAARPARARSAAACPPSGWATTGNSSVRAWVPRSDQHSATDLQAIVADATAALQAEQADMGSPVPDGQAQDWGSTTISCNPDPAIDIYEVNSAQYQPRTWKKIDPESYGETLAEYVPGVYGDTAFVEVTPEAVQHPDLLRSTLIHEIYHVLQFAHTGDDEGWFTEASATWAQIHYLPNSPFSQSYTNQAFNTFQTVAPHTLDVPFDDGYQDWIYPGFMFQEGVNPAAVWDYLASHPLSPNSQAVDQVFPFAPHFRDFTVRDYNRPYTGDSGGTLFQDTYTHLPSTKPHGIVPAVLPNSNFAKSSQSMTIPASLQGRYLALDVSRLHWASLDFSNLPTNVDVDALVSHQGFSTLQRLQLNDRRYEFCRDDAADADIQSIVLDFSNHSVPTQGAAPRSFSYRSASKCPLRVTGQISYTGSTNSQSVYNSPNCGAEITYNSTLNATGQATLNYESKPDGTSPFTNLSSSTLNGSDSYNEVGNDPCNSYDNYTYTVQGGWNKDRSGNQALSEVQYTPPDSSGPERSSIYHCRLRGAEYRGCELPEWWYLQPAV